MKRSMLILAVGLILFGCNTTPKVLPKDSSVTAVQEGDSVKVTWTYANAAANSVGLVGAFQGWSKETAVPFEKGADGIWRLTLTARLSDVFTYKFIINDAWQPDPNAPWTIKDGFGGKNGYFKVIDLLPRTEEVSQ